MHLMVIYITHPLYFIKYLSLFFFFVSIRMENYTEKGKEIKKTTEHTTKIDGSLVCCLTIVWQFWNLQLDDYTRLLQFFQSAAKTSQALYPLCSGHILNCYSFST